MALHWITHELECGALGSKEMMEEEKQGKRNEGREEGREEGIEGGKEGGIEGWREREGTSI